MKRQSVMLCLLPLLWLGAGCTPHDYYRDSHYRRPIPPQAHQRGYDARPQQKPRASSRALRKYRRYVVRCKRSIRKCEYRKKVIRRAIKRLRRTMYYQQSRYEFRRSRKRMHFYYRNIRKYHRCVSVYSHRMRWARAYYQRRYGVDPGTKTYRKRRFATRPRRYAQRNNRRFAQPPAGDARAHRHNYHRRRYQAPTTPVVPPAAPAPPIARQNPPQAPTPVQPQPVQPQPVQPRLAVPTPRVAPPVQPSQPALPNTDKVRRWMQYCMAERRKYPMQIKLRYRSQRSLTIGKHAWNSQHFAHKDIASIRPLQASAGRYVVLGADGRYSQAHCEDRTFHVWDTKTHHALKLRPPVTAFLMHNTHLLAWFQGKKHASVEETILDYNPTAGRAGLLIKTAFPAMKGRSRYLYLTWDLRANKITNAWTLGAPGCHSAYRPVGVTPDGGMLYYLVNDLRVTVKCGPVSRSIAKVNGHRYAQRLMALNLRNGSRRMVSRFANSRKRFDTFIPNRDFSKVAVVEYAELKSRRGHIFMIDTRSGRTKRYNAPLTPYGVLFSPDQRSLLVYNSKRGQIVRISLASGKRDVHKALRMGHAMGLSKDGRHVYLVYHGGVEVRDATTLKRIDYLVHRKMMGNIKFIHVDGSKVSGGVVFVKNGEKLYIQKLEFKGSASTSRNKIDSLRNQIHGLPKTAPKAAPKSAPKARKIAPKAAPKVAPKAAPKAAPRKRRRREPRTRPVVPKGPGLQYIEY